MEKVTINAELREKSGKGVARTLRREGFIPAVIYRAGGSSPLKMNTREMKRFLKSTAGEQVLLNLSFPDKSSKLALLKEYQSDPINGDILHADFIEISMNEKIRVMVHVTTTGEPIGVKRDKGILQHVLRQVEIESLPNDIPGHLELDITELLAGHSVHVNDIKPPKGVKILTAGTEVIALVAIPTAEEVKPAEAAVAATEEPAAPEVIKKGKKEEEKEEA